MTTPPPAATVRTPQMDYDDRAFTTAPYHSPSSFAGWDERDYRAHGFRGYPRVSSENQFLGASLSSHDELVEPGNRNNIKSLNAALQEMKKFTTAT